MPQAILSNWQVESVMELESLAFIQFFMKSYNIIKMVTPSVIHCQFLKD